MPGLKTRTETSGEALVTLAERRRWSVARIRCWPSTCGLQRTLKRPLRPTVVRASERQAWAVSSKRCTRTTRPRARRETVPVSTASWPSSACGDATSATSPAGWCGGALEPPVDCAEAFAGSANATATRAGSSRVRGPSVIDAFSGAYEVS